MASEREIKDTVFVQEIIRLKCEAQYLISQIEKTCGFTQFWSSNYMYIRNRYQKLCEGRKTLLNFLHETKIPLVVNPKQVETIDDLFRVRCSITQPLSASDDVRIIVFEHYLKYYFAEPIPDELQYELKQAHATITRDLKLMLQEVTAEEFYRNIFPPVTRRKKRYPTSHKPKCNINH